MDIKKIIEENGPISVSEFMGYALPLYYSNEKVFGKGGDFTTAPEITQVFGEMVGICIASQWIGMGAPRDVALIELGPGRGTLMKDFLRGTKNVEGFHDAIEVHMVETSPQLKKIQQESLKNSHDNISWHSHISEVPRKKSFFVANEFFDALPINQFVKTKDGWCENLVALDKKGELAFGLSEVCVFSDELDAKHPNTKEDDVIEINQSAITITKDIASTVKEFGGAGVFIDYGYDYYGYKDTLQGMKNHKFNDVLKNVGEADITAHVDFVALSEIVKGQGIVVCDVVTQRDFLLALGVEARRDILMKKISDSKKQQILLKAVERLVDTKQMGNLFKVLMFVESAE